VWKDVKEIDQSQFIFVNLIKNLQLRWKRINYEKYQLEKFQKKLKFLRIFKAKKAMKFVEKLFYKLKVW